MSTPQDNDEELLALFDDVNDQSFLYFRKRVKEFIQARDRQLEQRVFHRVYEWLELGSDMYVCPTCGAAVVDTNKHDSSHEGELAEQTLAAALSNLRNA